MTNKPAGFSAIESLLVIVAVLVIGGVAYTVYRHSHQTSPSVSVSRPSAAKVPAAGTTASIDQLTNQEINSTTSVDQQSTAQAEATAGSTNGTAADLGGAYNASSF